jgi:hypothetical protein
VCVRSLGDQCSIKLTLGNVRYSMTRAPFEIGYLLEIIVVKWRTFVSLPICLEVFL